MFISIIPSYSQKIITVFKTIQEKSAAYINSCLPKSSLEFIIRNYVSYIYVDSKPVTQLFHNFEANFEGI